MDAIRYILSALRCTLSKIFTAILRLVELSLWAKQSHFTILLLQKRVFMVWWSCVN